MNILDFSKRREEILRQAGSKYQSNKYLCLDVVTHENWIHRWRCVEVRRNEPDGKVRLWQFNFQDNKLEFQHYHCAVPSTKVDLSQKLLWKGLEVIEQYPSGYSETSHVDLEEVSVPDDVAAEAKRIFLAQLDQYMKLVYPE